MRPGFGWWKAFRYSDVIPGEIEQSSIEGRGSIIRFVLDSLPLAIFDGSAGNDTEFDMNSRCCLGPLNVAASTVRQMIPPGYKRFAADVGDLIGALGDLAEPAIDVRKQDFRRVGIESF